MKSDVADTMHILFSKIYKRHILIKWKKNSSNI